MQLIITRRSITYQGANRGDREAQGVGTKTKKAAHGGFFITDAALLGLLCRHRDRLCQ